MEVTGRNQSRWRAFGFWETFTFHFAHDVRTHLPRKKIKVDWTSDDGHLLGLQGRSQNTFTVDSDCYVATLQRFRTRLSRFRPRKHKNIEHDNARQHMNRQTVAALERLRFDDIILHPSYSLYLTSCDLFFFPKLKYHPKEHRNASDDELQTAVCVPVCGRRP